MKFLQVESIFYADHWPVCDGVEREEGTTVAGGVTWSLGVAAKLMETTQVRSTWRCNSPKFVNLKCEPNFHFCISFMHHGIICFSIQVETKIRKQFKNKWKQEHHLNSILVIQMCLFLTNTNTNATP